MPEIIDELRELFLAVQDQYGPKVTILIALSVVLIGFAWRVYNDHRKDKERGEALAEKERTIQRLARDNRAWRALFLKDKYGWTDQQVDRFLIANDFEDGPSARRHMENAQSQEPQKAAKRARKGKKRR